MAKPAKSAYNKTQLRVDIAEDRGIVHRDYLAHCLRWTHALRTLSKKGPLYILDVGSGVNHPMAMMLYTNRYGSLVSLYRSVDIRRREAPSVNFPCDVRVDDATAVGQWQRYDGAKPWDLVVSFELLEHMPKASGLQLLDRFSELPVSCLLLSTPCFNGKAAANHVYEWRFEELSDELQRRFPHVKPYGTFISFNDLKPRLQNPSTELDRSVAEVYMGLRGYYDPNVLAVLVAPLYPKLARNCLWELKPQNHKASYQDDPRRDEEEVECPI